MDNHDYEISQYGAAHQRPFYRDNVSRTLRVAGMMIPSPAAMNAAGIAHLALINSGCARVRAVALRIRERIVGDAHTYGVPEAEVYRDALVEKWGFAPASETETGTRPRRRG